MRWHDKNFDYRVEFKYDNRDNADIKDWVKRNIGIHKIDWVWWGPESISYFYCKTEENKVKFGLRWV